MKYSTCVTFALALIAGAVFTQGKELKPRILDELNSQLVDCPAEFTSVEICGTFHGGFSTFKFELEFELALADYLAEPVTSWKLLGGVYARTYSVGDEVVSIGFDRKRHLILLKRGVLPEPDDDEDLSDGDDDDDDDDDDADSDAKNT